MKKRAWEQDGTALLAQMAAGEKTAVSVMQTHLARLEKSQPIINGATAVFREAALEQAQTPKAGPLSGLPISIKETIGLAGENITAGSRRMPAWPQESDSAVVQRLREAGAIVVARSNVPEFAMAGETSNLLYGRTNNPLNINRVAGGSSGGEGALVGSGSTVFGIGSDILGSIRIPAAFCGVVGFKPASGAVPKAGTWPQLGEAFLNSWLALGPLTRSVRDARLVYSVIADVPAAAPQPIGGRRLIIPQPFFKTMGHPKIEAALVQGVAGLVAAGMQREERPFPNVKSLYLHMQKLVAHDLERPLREMLTTEAGERFSLLKETIRQLFGKPDIYAGLYQLLLVAPFVRPRRQGKAERLIGEIEAARRRLLSLLGEDGVLLLPTLGLLAPPHGAMNRASLRPGVNGAMTAITYCNYMNVPAITVPAWAQQDEATGLAPSLMLVAARGQEELLLDVAEKLEQIIG